MPHSLVKSSSVSEDHAASSSGSKSKPPRIHQEIVTFLLLVAGGLLPDDTHQQYEGPRHFLWFQIMFSQPCWLHIFWMLKAIRPCSLHNLRISFVDYLCMLYFTFITSKLEYISIVWNSLASADINMLECTQEKFASSP